MGLTVSNKGPSDASTTVAAGRGVGIHFDGDLRRALLDAAVAELDAGGADGLSLRSVARRAGVSHAAPAHHFGDRTGLLTVVAVEGFGLFTAHMATAITAATTDAADLAAVAAAYVAFADAHPGHFDVMFRPGLLRTDDPDFAAASHLAFDALRDHVAGLQVTGWRAGEDPADLAAGGWALAHGLAVLRGHQALARHVDDDSLDGVRRIVTGLLRPDG